MWGQVVIVDESHTLRTADRAPDSINTEAAVAAVKVAQAAVLLTGTPSLSRPFDLYRQVCTPSLHLCQASDVKAIHAGPRVFNLSILPFFLQGFSLSCCS